MEKELANLSLTERKPEQDADLHTPLKNQSATKSPGTPSTETKEKFMRFISKARQYAEDGNIRRAIELNEKALKLRYSDKLKKRIDKMKKFLEEQEDSDEDDGLKSLGKGFMLHEKIHDKLYAHQKEGVLWMWSLFTKGKGGILADDMGLGKTIQVIAFLAGMIDMEKIKTVLIVVPLSVLPNWTNEFEKWTPSINIIEFHGSSVKECERGLKRIRSRGGVVLTTYGLIVTRDIFASDSWDYVILDEGHRIKNPTKTSKSIHKVPAKQRIILTGTPVQNNLKELWSLFDYVHQGSLLGTVRTFKMEFETPIIRSRERDASAVEKRLGQEMSETLKGIIQPYFLRRTKAQVSKETEGDKRDDCIKMPTMTRKNDFVIWLFLTETQQNIYRDFISLDHVKELLMTKKSPLVALTVLKKICDHPRLLSTRACMQLGLEGDRSYDEEALEHPSAYESAANQVDKIPDSTLVGESGKMQVLVELVDQLKQQGHRTLIFSQSRKLLDIIQKVVTNRGHKVARLDGKVNQMSERDAIVKRFQKDTSYTLFLLTIQVGGVGLTITAADRVIIYDPNWNPATDAQAVDRAFRIGQDKNVVVYRLITCGTVEEKIYRRQVFKDSITQQTTGGSSNPYRYFTKMELKELFSLGDPTMSATQQQLQEMHASQRATDTKLDEHIAYLHSLDIFGISDHDLMFKQTKEFRDDEVDEEAENEQRDENNDKFIEYRIHKAQELINQESNTLSTYEERSRGIKKYSDGSSTGSGVTVGRVPPPSRNRPSPPAPSSLFSHVGNQDAAIEVDDDDDAVEVLDDNINDVVDITQAIQLDSDSDCSPQEEPERRVLQPLSVDEVRHRSPRVSGKGKVVKEELIISPDPRSPLMGLEKSATLKKRLEGAAGSNSASPVKVKLAELNSPTSSPNKNKFSIFSPIQKHSPKSGQQSPLKQGQLSPKVTLSPKITPALAQAKFLDRLTVKCSTPNIHSALSPHSPKSPLLASTSPHNMDESSDLSSASRKLDFGNESNLVNSPVVKKPKLNDNSPMVGKSPIKNIRDEICVSSSPVTLFADDSMNVSKSSGKKNKRRSVCVRQLVCDSDVEDSSNEKDSSSEEDNKENENSPEEDEIQSNADESMEDKENLRHVRKVGGRRILVSETESESGSCFEVEESTEEGEESQGELFEDEIEDHVDDAKTNNNDVEGRETTDNEVEMAEERDDENIVQDKESRVQEECREHDNESEAQKAESGVQEEENEEQDPEENEFFQSLVSAAKQLYKLKRYTESLELQQQALEIFPVPELLQMAEKTRLRAAQAASQSQ